MCDTGISNVVLITVDSLRADAVGAYGDERHTPVVDPIADRGAVFERAFATGNWTYIENVDGGGTELYYRPDDPTRQADLTGGPSPEERRVIEQFGSVVDAHADRLRTRGEDGATADAGEGIERQLDALGYR